MTHAIEQQPRRDFHARTVKRRRWPHETEEWILASTNQRDVFRNSQAATGQMRGHGGVVMGVTDDEGCRPLPGGQGSVELSAQGVDVTIGALDEQRKRITPAMRRESLLKAAP